MTLNKKDLEKMSDKLKGMEFDEHSIDLQKDASTQLTEKIAKETGLSIEEVLSVNNVIDDENKQSRVDVKNQQAEKVKVIKQKQIETMKKKIESKEVPDHIARVHFSNQEDFRKKLLEYFVGPDKPELIKQYESADELKDLFESKFEDAEKKHVGIVADELTPEVSQMVNDFQLPEELLVEDFTEDEFLEKVKAHIRTKGSTKLNDELKEHDDLIEKLLAKDQVKSAAKNKFEDYERKHVGALERKLGPEIIEALEKFEISDVMAKEPIVASDFNKKMRSILVEGNAKLKEVLVEHPELAEKIFGSDKYRDKEEEKYDIYEKKHAGIISKEFGNALAAEIDALEIPQEYLDKEMSPEDFQSKVFNSLVSKNRKLQDEMKNHPNLGIDKLTRQQDSIKNSLQRKQESLENKKTELTKTEILTEINNMKFTDAEIGNERLHKNQNAFAEAFKGRFTPGLLNKIQKRGSKIESFLQGHLKTTLYARWEKEHETAEQEEKKGNLLKAAQNDPLPAELNSEDMNESQFLQKYFDTLAEKDPELQEAKHKGMRDALSRDTELQTAMKERFKEYQEAREGKMLEEIKEEMNQIKYTDEEKLNDDYHNKPDVFAKFILEKRLSPERMAQLGKLSPEKRANFEAKLRQHAKERLYSDWLNQHETAEKAEAKQTLINLINNRDEIHTPKGMKDEFASEDDFKNAMWPDVLRVGTEKNNEWQESDHIKMLEELLKDPDISSALSKRYSTYKEKFREKTQEALQKELESFPSKFTQQEIDNDDFHENPEGFAAEMINRLPETLRKKMKSVDLEDLALQQLKGSIYKDWLKKHETAEEKKFTKELEEKIMGQELTPEFAATHYKEGGFKTAWFDLIKNGLSEDLKGEHKEVLEKLLGKERVERAFAAKFEAYEKMHDKAMEEKFSTELSLLISSTAIPADLASKNLSQDELKREWFAVFLKNASPELREELGEHRDLEQKLFGNGRVQQSLEDSYKKYEKQHEVILEQKHAEELAVLINSVKIPSDLAKGLTEAQFTNELMEMLIKNAPELQAQLKKKPDFMAKLLGNSGIKGELTKKYAEYQKAPLIPKEPKENPKAKELQAHLENLKKDGKISADFDASIESKDFSDEELEEMLVASPNAVKKLLAKKSKSANQKPQAPAEGTREEHRALEAEVKKLSREGVLPEGVRFKDLKKEQQEQVLQQSSPELQRAFKVKSTEEKADPEMPEEKSQKQKKAKKINPEQDVGVEEDFKGDLDEVLDQDIGRDRMNSMMKSFALRKLMEKSHRRRLFEKFFIQWSAQLKESEFRLFRMAVIRKNTTIEEAFALMFKTPQRRLAASRIRKFSPKVWLKFGQGLKYVNMSTSQLVSPPKIKPASSLRLEEKLPYTQKFIQEEELAKNPENLDEVSEQASAEEIFKEEKLADEGHLLPEEDTEVEQEASEENTSEEEVPSQDSVLQNESEDTEELEEEDLMAVPIEEEDASVERKKESSGQTAEKIETTPEHRFWAEKAERETSEEEVMIRRRESIPQKNKEILKPTDPLKELEKFRKQLMNQFKHSAEMERMRRTFDLLGINIEPFYEIASEERSEFLESLRVEMETNSMSLGNLLKKFVRYIRFVSDHEIPANYSIPASLMEHLVKNPAEIFQSLNEHYFSCREQHEKTTDMRFSTPYEPEGNNLNLVFEVHKDDIHETCAASIPCTLVTEEDRRVPQAA